MMLAAIDLIEEAVIRRYHTTEGYLPADDEPKRQEPLLTPAEVEAEIHTVLVASVMVGGPE